MKLHYSKWMLMALVAAVMCCAGGVAWADVQYEGKLIAADGTNDDSYGFSVAVFDDRAIIGMPYDDHSGYTDVGAAYIFKRTGTNWLQEVRLTGTVAAAAKKFGRSVAITSNKAIVGEASDAYVFLRTGTNWTQEVKWTHTADGGAGLAVDIYGNRAIVGNSTDDSVSNNAGAAWIYKWGGASWTQEKKITGAGIASYYFGNAVSLSSNRAIVGESSAETSTGYAYVFVLTNGTNWVQEQRLDPPTPGTFNHYGCAVGISGDKLIVGEYRDGGGTETGSVHFYQWDGSNWTNEQTVAAPVPESWNDAYFGKGVAIDGNRALVSEPGDNNANGVNAGSAHVIVWNGSNWIHEQEFFASDGAANDNFGGWVTGGIGDDGFPGSVGIYGDTYIVGARYHDLGALTNAGAAYINFPLPPQGPRFLFR